jgi:hypothetical protein
MSYLLDRKHNPFDPVSQVQYHRRFVAEDVADRDSLRNRAGVEEVETGSHRLKQAKTRRWWKARTPDVADHNLGAREQRSKLRRIALVTEDLRLQRHFGLGENAWSDACGEMAEK